MTIKIREKMKYRSQRYNINRSESRRRHKYTKHKLSQDNGRYMY